MSTLHQISRAHIAELKAMAAKRSDYSTRVEKLNMLQKVKDENRSNRRLGTRVERRLNKLPFDRIRAIARAMNER
ncbi:hypothetical protein [Vreelandella venusta]|uniref:hypothetical protein n=1 Tax=Vreelandella venusta TaxID=44935 RepID=UPI00200F6FEA|nr:hypothetical protein [Halomonas venusta]UQI42700.1 hypothetical protein M3L73_10740 [Halomonas venusta]